MVKYELVFILKADLPESELEAHVEKASAIIAEHKGEVTLRDHWGVRRLAYEIEDETKGNYMFMKFRSEGTVVKALDREFRLDDLVLRHLIVRDEEWAERNRAARAKQRAKKAKASEPAAAASD
ncbi:MAG: 30S ribosomal protein S6 [bacterium]